MRLLAFQLALAISGIAFADSSVPVPSSASRPPKSALPFLRLLYPKYRVETGGTGEGLYGEGRVLDAKVQKRSDGTTAVLVALSDGDRTDEVALFEPGDGNPRMVARKTFTPIYSEQIDKLASRELRIGTGQLAIEVILPNIEEDGPHPSVSLFGRDGDRLVEVYGVDLVVDTNVHDCDAQTRTEVSTRKQGATWDLVETITENVHGCRGKPIRHERVHHWDGKSYP
jgi:hypothetical protein